MLSSHCAQSIEVLICLVSQIVSKTSKKKQKTMTFEAWMKLLPGFINEQATMQNDVINVEWNYRPRIQRTQFMGPFLSVAYCHKDF